MKESSDRKAEGNPSGGQKGRSSWANPNRRRFLYQVNILVMCGVTLAALGGCVLFLVRGRTAESEKQELEEQLEALQGENKSLYTAEELAEAEESAREEGAESGRSQILMQIQSDMQSGTSTASMLRSLFPDDIVVVSGGKYYFYPVSDEIPSNPWSSEDFTQGEDGRLSYVGSEEVRLLTGVSVSDDDGDIDWDAVSGDDISYVMVEAGQRLVSDSAEADAGEILTQSLAPQNAQAASAAGLSVGAFWTLGATSQEEAQEEAQALIEALSEVQNLITLPVAVCVNVPSETDRTVEQGRADWTSYVTLFCTALEEEGYQPMIYGSLASFVLLLDLEELEPSGWSRWISNQGSSLYFPYEFSQWEYSSAGAVQGISTEVRLSAMITAQ